MRTALKLSGADALTLLNRLTTNLLAGLTAGEWRPTLFCDFRGRLFHRAIVAHAGDGAVWLLRDDADGDALADFVDRFVFREDVRIENCSGAPMPALDLSQPLPAPLSERERIEAGLPRHGHEIAEAFTPYEVGLAHEVHLSKGCYTGQEALQRLVTYDSARRQLARVSGEGAVPALPADVFMGSDPAGVITSALATDGRWIGLASLRRDRLERADEFTLAGSRSLEREQVFELTHPQGRPR